MRSLAGALVLFAACGDNVQPTRVLFIRGGSGTAGFVEGGTDDHLSDITDYTDAPLNRGYGQFADALREDEYVVEQIAEGPASNNTKVDLRALDLDRYAVIVFGSNNATYDASDAERIRAFVEEGGGVLFSSDANWGSNFDKAPSSDQTFLTQFGLIMNQDGGGLTRLSGSDFLVPDHPIFDRVTAFEGEGVSPCMLSHDPAALAEPQQLAITREVVRRNTAPVGPVEPATPDDASLTVVEYGRGRVACHFDRNTFFNTNGAGTSIAAASNRRYGLNLIGWLARRI